MRNVKEHNNIKNTEGTEKYQAIVKVAFLVLIEQRNPDGNMYRVYQNKNCRPLSSLVESCDAKKKDTLNIINDIQHFVDD